MHFVNGRVRANVAFERLFAVVRPRMHFIRISIREDLPASFAFERLISRMQLGDVASQISFSATNNGTQGTLVRRSRFWEVSETMSLQGIGLAERGIAYITFVRSFPGMYLKFEIKIETLSNVQFDFKEWSFTRMCLFNLKVSGDA